jgi:hypothetical protein
MAKADDTANTPAPGDGWREISEDMAPRFQFQEIGEEFIGKFLKVERVDSGNGNAFHQYVFEVADGSKVVISPTARLRVAMTKVRPNTMVRIRYVGDFEQTDLDKSPMKDLRVDVKR